MIVSTADDGNIYRPDIVLPPGDTLAEVLDDTGMTQVELARRTGLSTKHINQIVNGATAVTPGTALLLERTTGVSSQVWNSLEVAYRGYLSRLDDDARLASDLDWLQELPVAELVKRKLIRRCREPLDQLHEICRFFGVANRSAWEAVWHKPTAFRISKAFASDPGAVAAWLRIGEIEAAAIDCAPFDRRALLGIIDKLRALTLDADPHSWWPKLVAMCASVGVAIVAEPEIKGARINGATRWLTPNKALIQLSLRHRWSDIVWFTFIHELAHVIMHSKKDTFINDKGSHSGVEQEADAFAAQTLIPRHYEADLAQLTTPSDARRFAAKIGIAPGIVVGRLQYDRRWPYSKGNELKQRFVFGSDT